MGVSHLVMEFIPGEPSDVYDRHTDKLFYIRTKSNDVITNT